MANCLVTKLKGVVDNDNLDYLDWVKINGTFLSDQFSDNIFNEVDSNVEIRLLNTDGATISRNGGYVDVTKGSTNKLKLLVPRYLLPQINILGVNVQFDVLEFSKIFNLNTFSSNNSHLLNKDLSVFANFPNLLNLSGSEYAFNGNISALADCPKLQTISFTYSPYIQGDLSSIKDMPNLTNVRLDHTYITDNNDAVTYMRNRGIEVTYVPYDE